MSQIIYVTDTVTTRHRNSCPQLQQTVHCCIFCAWMPVESIPLRCTRKGHGLVAAEANLLLHKMAKNDSARIRSLCQCGVERHDPSTTIQGLQCCSPWRLIGVNRAGRCSKSDVCGVCTCSVLPAFVPPGSGRRMHITQRTSDAPESWVLLFLVALSLRPKSSGANRSKEKMSRMG